MVTSSAMSNTTPVHELVGQWGRPRGFGLGPFGEKWWYAPLNKTAIKPVCLDYDIPVTAIGVEVIEVVDVAGDIASYRKYLVNPDGDLVRVSFAPHYSSIWTMPVGQLRGVLKRMKMVRGAVVKPEAPKAKLHAPQTAKIIPFPEHRIVSRRAIAK
jgi:hypothetical protein